MVDPGPTAWTSIPSAGTAVPRLTQTGVVVSASSTSMGPVDLPSGELVNGVVLDASDGSPLPSVWMRFFQLACSGAEQCYGTMRVEPLLRAEAHSDASGAFQAVIPVQQ